MSKFLRLRERGADVEREGRKRDRDSFWRMERVN